MSRTIQTRDKVLQETNLVRELVHGSGFKKTVLVVVHVLLVLAMSASSLFATVHALFTIALGLMVSLFSKDIRKAAYVAAYITGAEVLWRMTDAHIFWEAGKYFTVFIFGIALLRIKPWQRFGLPVLYIGLLSVSIPLTLLSTGVPSIARAMISFNLSGPVALAVCAIYFAQMDFDEASLRQVVWWIVLPILGIAVLVVSGVISAETIVFTDNSNYVTSGGFGPNQTSAILGLGGSLAFLLFLTSKKIAARSFFIFLMFWFLSLSALTFSRGGLYNAAIMIVLTMVHFFNNPRRRFAAVLVTFLIGLVGGYLIFPRLNLFTGGMLEQRLANLDTTSRGLIAQADLDLWFSHPVLGVGPGMSPVERIVLLGRSVGAHTEYTRVLAEHGLLGMLALLLLFGMVAQAYFRASSTQAKVWVAALAVWPLLEMTHAAMRIVAVSFLFGLAMVDWGGESLPVKHQKGRR